MERLDLIAAARLVVRELAPGRLLRIEGAAPLEERVANVLAALDP